MLLILIASLALASSQVISANHKNFKDVVIGSNHAIMVEFFAPWCGHCKALEPEYKKAAQKLKGLAKLVAVDCDNQDNKGLCGQYGVQGFPTLKIFPAGKKGTPSDYQGAREANAIANEMKSHITPRFISKIGGSSKKSKTLDEFKSSSELQKVILVTDKKATPVLFKFLSIEYLNRLSFAELKKTEKEVEKLGVTKFPTILVLPTGAAEFITYDGPIKQESLIEFLDKYAPPLPKTSSEKNTDKKRSKPKAKFDPKILELKSQTDLENCTKTKSKLCLVSFFPLESDYPESVAQKDENLKVLFSAKEKLYKKDVDVTFAWVNVIEHGSKFVKDFGVSDFYPSVVALTDSHYALSRMGFEGDAIVEFVQGMLKGKGKIAYKHAQLDSSKKDEL